MIFEREIILKAYNSELSPDVCLYVSSYYEFLFKKQIANPECQNCIRDAAIEILIKMNSTRKYIVLAHIPIFWKGKWYTQADLTDDIAEDYLKENPADIVKFKKYPKQAQKKAV